MVGTVKTGSWGHSVGGTIGTKTRLNAGGTRTPGCNMARSGFGAGNIDVVDILALIAIPLFSGVEFDVWTLAVDVFGGHDFSDALFTVGATDISIAFIGTLLAIGVLAVNGTVTRDDYEQEEWAMIAGALALPALYVFVPAVESVIAGYDMVAFGAWVVISGVSVYVSTRA